MGKNGTARRAIHENTIRRMRLACWITKDTDTHAEFVVLIVLARQQCLCERSSALRHTYMARVVYLHLYSDICWQPWFGRSVPQFISSTCDLVWLDLT